jgi:uncharacterized protein YceK
MRVLSALIFVLIFSSGCGTLHREKFGNSWNTYVQTSCPGTDDKIWKTDLIRSQVWKYYRTYGMISFKTETEILEAGTCPSEAQ